MSALFTSDLHLGHQLVAGIRGFSSVEEHDQAVVDSIASRVSKSDVLWVLGDLTLKRPRYALDALGPLPCRLRLILGNHDAGHPMHRDAPRHFREYLDVFELVATSARTRVCGTDVLLSHFPYTRDRDREGVRYAQWRLPDMGMPLVHGHLHTRDYGRGSEVHVGWDAWRGPVPDVRVAELLQGSPS